MPKAGSPTSMDEAADTTPPEKIAGEGALDDAPDTPVMDVAAEQPVGGIVEAPEATTPTDVPDEGTAIVDEGIAPIAAEPAEIAELSDHIPDTPADEIAQIGRASCRERV